ncbi:MAG: exo-alpha-sialidase [Planctomycetes bacterium]|nr:exo-alpha-sialidase [Planctomycetota bacterium]
MITLRDLRWLAPLALACLCQPGRLDAQSVSRQQLFVSGTQGYHTFRIPALVRAADGALLAFCEGRVVSGRDDGDIDIVMRRSTDDGRTWSALAVVQQEGTETIGNPAPVLDSSTGRLWLLFCRNNDRVFETHSDDHGATWSSRRELTASVKLPGWGWYATGPVHGIQLTRGTHTGRLVVPCDHRDPDWRSHVVYSDDHGATWAIGGIVQGTSVMGPNECTAVELTDGRVALNMRDQRGAVRRRIVAYSADGGASFGAPGHDPALIDPVVQAAWLRLEATDRGDARDWIVFSNPASEIDRVNLTIRSSFDETGTWSTARTLWGGPSAYSDLAVAADGTVCCLFEGGVAARYEYIELARFDRAWLAGGLPSALAAHAPIVGAAGGSLGGATGGLGFAGSWRETPGARLAGHWPFELDVRDASGLGRDGTRVGATFDTDVPAALGTGTSLRFDGQGAHVDLSAHVGAFAGLAGLTIAAFFKTAGTGAHAILAASDSGDPSSELRLFVEGGRLRYDARGDAPSDGQVVSPASVDDDRWHHAAVTVDHHGYARLYVDGTEVAADLEPGFTAVRDLDRMAIGRNVDSGGPQWFFTGLLDDVLVVEQALEPAAIAALASGHPVAGLTARGDPAGVGVAAGSLDSAAFRQSGLTPVGDRIAEAGGAAATRPLTESISAGTSGACYVACLARLPAAGGAFAVRLEEPRGVLAQFGVEAGGRFAVGGAAGLVPGPVAAPVAQTLLLVCELRTSVSALPSVRLKVYLPGDTVDPDPSGLAGVGAGAGQWTAELAAAPLATGIADHLTVAPLLGSAVEIDELRLGGSFPDVLGGASGRRRVGLGCPAQPATPDLWSVGLPFPGNVDYRVDLLGVPVGAPCALLAGFVLAAPPIPLAQWPGCALYVAPPLVLAASAPALPPTGLASFPLAVPAQPALIGAALPLQALATPVSSSVAPSLSNALVLEF